MPDQEEQEQPVPEEIVIHPQPLPTQIVVSIATLPNGERQPVLVFYTPQGTDVHFLEPRHAEKVANDLLDAARKARLSVGGPAGVPPGLIVPG